MPAHEPETAAQLRYIFVTHFGEGDLRDLCHSLDIAYGDLPGLGKQEKVEAMVTYFARRRRLAELVANAKRLRPDLSWGDPSQAPLEVPPTPGRPPRERLLVFQKPERRGCAGRWTTTLLLLVALAAAAVGLRTMWTAFKGAQSAATVLPVVLTPTSTVPPQAAATGTPTIAPTPTPTAPATPTAVPSLPATSTPTYTATPSSPPALTPTLTLSPTATSANTHTPTPTPPDTPTPTLTPTHTPAPVQAPNLPVALTSTPLPAPVLFEPESGASFAKGVRLKFIWYRRLQANERFSIYAGSVRESAGVEWWASEADILRGGGAIHEVEGGYRFEVNFGLAAIPLGEAFWRVAAVGEAAGDRWQVSPWSEERQIFRVPWPGKRLGKPGEQGDSAGG